MKNLFSISMLFGIGIAGCVEPPYRYEIHDTGEGTVRVETVPKTPVPAPASPAPVSPAPTAAPTVTDQQRIDALEAQVRALSQENQKLKQTAPTTPPTTAPAKE